MRNLFSMLASGMLFVVVSLIGTDLTAQCTPSFVTGDVTIELDNTTGLAQISTAELIGVINKSGPDCGNFLFFSGLPADGQTGIPEPYALDCDSVGILTLWIVLDDLTDGGDNDFDAGVDYGPWQVNVTVQDNTDPTIDVSSGATPDCGGNFVLTTNNDYTFAADAVVLGAVSSDDCLSTLEWTHPDFIDNCGWTTGASVVISYTAGSAPPNDPQALPADVTITFAQIADSSSALTSAPFYSSATGCNAITIVTYTVTDANGNTSTCSFTVEVSDDEAPAWDGASTATGLAAAMTNEVSIVSTPAPFDPESFLITVTLDCNSPTFLADSIAAIDFVPLATDNCDPAVVVTPFAFFDTPIACTPTINGPIYNSTGRDYAGEDNCGNTIDAMVDNNRFRIQVDVIDNTSPTFVTVPSPIATTSGPSTAQMFEGGTVTLNVSDYDPSVCEIDLTGDPLLEVSAEDCQGIIYYWEIITSVDPFNVPTGLAGTTGGPDDNNADIVYPVGVHEIAYYAEDDCGLVSTYLFDLEIIDDVVPVISNCPADITANNVTDLCENTIIWELPSAVDNCMLTVGRTDQAFDQAGFPINVVVFAPDSAFAIFPVGINQVFHIYEDTLGNIDTCTFQVTIFDAQLPEITCGGDLDLFSICGTAPLPNYMGNIAVIDENCPGYTLAQYPAPGTLLNVIKSPNPVDGDTIHVSLIITDLGGNMDTCTFVVTLIDDDAPIPTVDPLPSINTSTTLFTSCGSFMLCAPTATDCNSGTTIYATTSISGSTFDPNGCGPGMPGYLIHNPGNYSISWLYVAGNGKSTVQIQQVDIEADTTAPTLNCPPDITVDTDPGICTTTGIAGLTMTEIFPTLAPYLDPMDNPASGEMIDNCGIDMFEWFTTFDAAATPNPNAFNAGVATYPLGASVVTYRASDEAGNSATCSFTVTVEDNENPSFNCPGLAGIMDATILLTGSLGDANTIDCGYTLDNGDTSLDPTGLFDNCGNPSMTYVMALFGGAISFIPGPSPSSLAGSTFTIDPNVGFGSFRVTWTVTDGNGNFDTCERWFVVDDGQAPEIVCPNSPLIRTTSQDGFIGDCLYYTNGTEFDPLSVSDNCSVIFWLNDYTFTPSLNGFPFNGGSTIVTWTVYDIGLNTATCQIEIIINDDEAPVNTYCPTSVVLPNIAGNCNNDVLWLRPDRFDWTDNCDPSDSLTVTEVISDPGVQAAINNNYPYDDLAGDAPQTSFPVGLTTILYTATDTSGNTSTCLFTVTILDIEAPTVTCPPLQILGTICAAGIVPDYRPLATNIQDNCPDSLIITQSPAPGTPLSMVGGLTPADGEIFTVTITVTDGLPNGLSSNCTFDVELNETNLPVPDLTLLPDEYSDCGTIDIAAPTANDCGNVLYGVPNQGMLIQLSPPIYRYTTGLYNVIWTYIGASGNTFQGQQIVVEDDTTPPNALCQSQNVNLSSGSPGTVTLSALDFDNGSTDNCAIDNYTYSVDGGAFFSLQSFGCDDVGVHLVQLNVTDTEGNVGSCFTSLTINDVTDPTIVGGCPMNMSFTTSNNGGYDCYGEATITAPNVTDNCDIVQYTLTIVQPDATVNVLAATGGQALSQDLLKGISIATFLVTDEHGNTSSCSFTITITDNEVPQIVCANDGTRFTSDNTPGDCLYEVTGKEFDPVSFVDNCPGATISNNYNFSSTLEGELLTPGTYTITWTVTDAVGLQATCDVEITIVDDEAPIINFCQSDIAQVATTGTCNALVSWSPTFDFDVADNCGIDNLNQAISNPSVIPVYPYLPFGPYPPFLLNHALFPIGMTTVSYTVTDIHGNSSVCSFVVEITDDQAPSITCPPNQTLNTVCATGTVPDYTGLISNLTDNCVANLIITQDPAAGTLLSNVPGLTPADGEVFIVTITASDPNPLGLSDQCSFFVTLNDVNLPIPDQASLPKDSTDCEVLVVSPPTANDCGNTIIGIPDKGVQISFNPPLYQFTTGLYTVIWTYVGTNGSVQQVQQIIVEEDLVPPVVTCVNTTINLSSNGTATLLPSQVTGSITDNCGIATVTVSPSSFNCANVGTNIVTLTATDIHGNSSWCMATVTVQDVTPPTFNISNSVIIANCQSVPAAGNVLATDACGILSFNLSETSSKGANANNCNFYTYTIVRTWTAVDVNGNVASVQQTINVQDVTAPTWTTAMPDTVKTVTNQFDCKGPIILIVDNAKVFDNCAAFANLSFSWVGSNNTSGTTNASGQYPIGNTTLVFTATDPCGNSSTKVVIIVVEDQTPPTPVCINSITLPLNQQGLLVIPAQVVDNGSFDNCLTPFSTSDVFLSVFPDSFDCEDAGKSLIATLTVTDLAGNTATCPAIINIIDNTIPTLISCAPDVTISCTASIDPAVLGEPIITDACGTDFTYSDNIVQVGGSICYRIDRTWLLIDGSGNNLTCLQRISVFDNGIPQFTSQLPQNIVVQCGNQIPSPASLTANDNCGVPVITFAVNSTKTSNLTCSDYAYTISRTWTATDACLNKVTHVQTVTIIDTLDPVISGLPDSMTLYTNDFNADSCAVPVTLVAQVDDCQPDSVIAITNNGPYGPGSASASGKYPAGLYPITFTATDRCNNSSQKTTILRVIDNSIPTAVCFSNVTVALNSQGFGVLIPSQIDDQSRDNCTPHALLQFELSQDSFDCENLGTQIVSLTVTDQAGNTNVCTSTVNVTAGPTLQINTSVNVVPETFPGAQNGAISVIASGGSGSFSYLWSPGGATTPSITGLSSGTYILVVTDLITGCKKTVSVFVFIAGSPVDTISGRILTPAGIPVARTYVKMTGTQSGTYYTGIDGYYQFTVPSGSNVTITPTKDTLPANGVTSLDFAIIQQHILAPPNLKPLTTPYQLIAADQNGNNAINGIDIAQFQSTILNNAPFFPNVTSWVFVDAAFVFPLPLEPWGTGWAQSVTFLNISGNKPNTDFIGVKMGDVTGDVDVTKITGEEGPVEVRSGNELELILPDLVLETGARIDVPVYASNFDAMRAYQLSWKYDPSVLKFQGVGAANLPNIGQGNFGFNQLTSGEVPHLWFNGASEAIGSDVVLYTLQFDVLQGGTDLSNVLGLAENHMGRIAYYDSGESGNILLQFRDTPFEDPSAQVSNFELLGNRPNPFSNQTLIEFTLPEKMEVKLTITDLTGRAVAVIQTEGTKGKNGIPITQDQIPTPGIYLYRIEAGTHQALGKMIQQD